MSEDRKDGDVVEHQGETLELFFQDLAKTLKHHEDRAKRLVEGIGVQTDGAGRKRGKPSRKSIADTFAALLELIETCHVVSSCTMNHTQSLAHGMDFRVRGLIKLFEDRGLITVTELEEKIKSLLEADQKAKEEAQQQALEDSLSQAKEEAAK